MDFDFSQFYISTISDSAIRLSKEYGFGIESTEFSYAENMDTFYDKTLPKIQEYSKTTNNLIFHAPFYELSMACIDSKAKQLSFDRYNQFYNLCKFYNPKKLVYHSGFLAMAYYKEWFLEQSINFLKEFMKDKNITICLENVFGDEPEFIYEIVSKVNNENLKICLDIGHVNAYSKHIKGFDGTLLVKHWVDVLYPYINHVHIHNNDGKIDYHRDVFDGTLDIKEILYYIKSKVGDVTYTVEVMNINKFPAMIKSICK